MSSIDFIADEELKFRTYSIVNAALNELYNNHYSACLLKVIEAYDEDTYYHGISVAHIAVALGIRIGLSVDIQKNIAVAGIFHDAGKVNVSIDIINKNGKLTLEEYQEVQKHSRYGHDLIKNVNFNKDICDGVLEHHERWDGRGYPYGKQGKNISLFGRILIIADVYDALVSKRPYHKPLLAEEAKAYMQGLQYFDKSLLDEFLQIKIVS